MSGACVGPGRRSLEALAWLARLCDGTRPEGLCHPRETLTVF
jgi:hypothetical protein